jgi:hypothetical protein
LARYGTAFTEAGSEFCAVELSQYDGPTEADLADLAALSAEFDTDVLWLGFCSASESFRFHHWRSGRQVRALAFGWFGEQGVWELAEGAPEPWERAAFFDARSLARWLEGAGEAEAVELRRVWAAAEVRAGRPVPSIDARESARATAAFYRLPGWS